jgi:hypothetical protein
MIMDLWTDDFYNLTRKIYLNINLFLWFVLRRFLYRHNMASGCSMIEFGSKKSRSGPRTIPVFVLKAWEKPWRKFDM